MEKRVFYFFSMEKLTFYTEKYCFWVQSTIFHQENLVFDVKSCIFLRKPSSLNWKNGFLFFSIEKLTFYTVKYYSWCRVLFCTRKTSFSMLNLVYFLENHLFQCKNGISIFFSIEKLTFYTVKYYSWCSVLFCTRRNLVFDIKSCIFLRKPSFELEKRVSIFFL